MIRRLCRSRRRPCDCESLEQVLTHTAGFPNARLESADAVTEEGRRQALSRWRLDWAPGTRFEYHPTSSHWVLADLIRSVTGEDHRTSFERRIRVRLGPSRPVLGLDLDDQDDIPPLRPVGMSGVADVAGAITLDDPLSVVDPEPADSGRLHPEFPPPRRDSASPRPCQAHPDRHGKGN